MINKCLKCKSNLSYGINDLLTKNIKELELKQSGLTLLLKKFKTMENLKQNTTFKERDNARNYCIDCYKYQEVLK